MPEWTVHRDEVEIIAGGFKSKIGDPNVSLTNPQVTIQRRIGTGEEDFEPTEHFTIDQVQVSTGDEEDGRGIVHPAGQAIICRVAPKTTAPVDDDYAVRFEGDTDGNPTRHLVLKDEDDALPTLRVRAEADK